MPTPLPSTASLTGAGVTQGTFKTQLAAIRQYLADLLAATGDSEDSFLRQWGIGEVKTFAYDFAPVDDGTIKIVACDGAAYSRTAFPIAFARLGTLHGSGDGSTTFNMPPPGRVWVGAGTSVVAFNFATTDVNTGTDVITVPSNESLYTGTPAVFSTTGTPPAPLVASTTYYWIKLSATTGKLATSLANAIAGTAIDLTTQGAGTHTVTINYTTRTVGQKFGEETHAQVIGEVPSHAPTAGALSSTTVTIQGISQGGDGAGIRILPYRVQSAPINPIDASTISASTSTTVTVNPIGGSGAMNNTQPSVVGKQMIRIK